MTCFFNHKIIKSYLSRPKKGMIGDLAGVSETIVRAGRAKYHLRPILAADENFSPFFAFLAKTRPKPPFGIPRALQPPKTNIIIFLVILLRIDSHSTYYI